MSHTHHKRIEPPSEGEIEAIWDYAEEFIVAGGARSSGDRLHLTDGDGERLCAGLATITYGDPQWRTKPAACYPVDHHPVCLKCVKQWREND